MVGRVMVVNVSVMASAMKLSVRSPILFAGSVKVYSVA